MNKFALLTIATLAALAAQPAAAAKYKCACETNAKSGIESSSDPKMSCAETYSGYNSSVSVQESHLKIYVDSDNTIQGDKDANIRFRPRDGKCLERVADGNAEKVLWEGAYCNNDAYKDIGQFKLKEKNGKWTATFEARTGGKDYTGFLTYAENSGKRYMQAACLEDK